MNEIFRIFADKASRIFGSSWAFSASLALIILWVFTGPFLHFSDTWQLTINTGTTIVTFLMVFLIQNTQNRNSDALQIKLDEVIRAQSGARASLIDLEDLSDEQIDNLKKQFADMGYTERSTNKDNNSSD